MHTPFSVLMSLYIKERPEFLYESLNSVFSQTLPPDEVILVLDGPITKPLQKVVDDFSKRFKQLKIIPLPHNKGLGRALNEGLKHCSYDLVVRMDTDDICFNYRFKKQVDYMASHPEVDVCGSWITEFENTPENILSTRQVPEDSKQIATFIKGRNPFNHPTVIFRKQAVLRVGGYQHFYLLEDWYLWARMYVAGAKMHNLQEPLLYFRTSPDMMKRRGGVKYAKSCQELFKYFKKAGIINSREYLYFSSIKYCVAIMPNSVRKLVYNTFLRNKVRGPKKYQQKSK